jgi:hypothetical protein
VDAPHGREVDHDPAVVHGVARHVVSTSPHRKRESLIAGEAQRRDHVRRAVALHDQPGPPIDEPILNPARVVVRRIAGPQDAAAHAPAQGFHRVVGWRRSAHRFSVG